MSSLLKLRRGSTVAHETFTGADGEVTFNTDTNALVTHDGSTAGGFPHVKSADLAASGGAVLVGNTPSGTVAAMTVQAAINELDSEKVACTALAASSGSSLVGYMPAGVGAVAMTVQAKFQEDVSLRDKGTIANMLTALNSIASDFSAAGGNCEIGAGTWVLPSGFTYVADRLTLIGKGRQVTRISFDPAAPEAALTINNVSSGGSNQGAIKNIGFTSANVIAKTAIKLVNVANWDIEGIAMSSGGWNGDSIGIHTYGRQMVRIKQSELVCARPIVMSQNATWPSLSTDHFVVSDCELIGTSATRPVIEIESGTSFTNTTFERLAVVGGQHGIYFNDTTATASSFNLKISDARFEQGMDPAGWAIYLSPSVQQLQSVEIKNVQMGLERNGIYINALATRVLMENVDFSGGAGKTVLQMIFTAGSRLTMINCWNQSGSAMTLTNARCIRRESVVGIGAIEEWVYDNGPEAGFQQSDVPHQGKAVSVTDSTAILIASVNYCGFVFISTSEDVSAIYILQGPTGNALEVTDPAGFFNPTKDNANSYNIYYEAGNYYIQNKRGTTQTVSIYKIGTTA